MTSNNVEGYTKSNKNLNNISMENESILDDVSYSKNKNVGMTDEQGSIDIYIRKDLLKS